MKHIRGICTALVCVAGAMYATTVGAVREYEGINYCGD